jgi:flagellar biosynthesis protein FlhA
MPTAGTVGWRATIAHNRGLVFPVLIVTSVLILVAPLPPVIMDLLLACNVAVSVVILLTTIYVSRRPLEFSVFPTILLGTTLVRLVLNVASTRLILTGAKDNGTRDELQIQELKRLRAEVNNSPKRQRGTSPSPSLALRARKEA